MKLLLKCFIPLDIALILSELNNYGSTLKEKLLILTKFQINFMHFDHQFVSKQIANAPTYLPIFGSLSQIKAKTSK